MYYKEPERSPYSTVQSVTGPLSENSLESQVSSSREKVGTPLQKPKMINNKQVFIIGNGESRIGFDLEKLRDYGKIYGCNSLYKDFTPDALIAIDERIMHPCYWSGYPIDNVCWFRDWDPMPGNAYELLTDSSMITGDPNVDMSEYTYSNPRNESTAFVLHGTHKDQAESLEKEVRELDTGKTLNQETYDLVFKAGIYTTWLNTQGDKVRNIGPCSFPVEYGHTHRELYEEFRQNAPKGAILALNAGPTAQLIASLEEEPTEIYLIGFDLYSLDGVVNNVYKGTPGYLEAGGNVIPSDDFIIEHRDLFNLFPNIKHFKVNKHPLGTDAISREIKEWKGIPNVEYLTYAELFGRLASG